MGGDVVRFAVIGDYGWAGQPAQAVSALVKSWDPAWILTNGDNNYPSGEASTIDQNVGQYYHEFIAPYTGAYGDGAAVNRFFPTLGNHDWYTAGAIPYLDYFSLPGNERYYDFVDGPVHLFAIDSDPQEPDGVSSASTQAQWLQAGLAASSSCWNIVYFHHPPHSSGYHGPSTWMRWPFHTWGADSVLAGHEHSYERIVLDGFPYFVNGSGGRNLRPFGTPVAGSEVRDDDHYGAMRVTVSRTAILYEFIATDGTVVDTYSQNGGCPPP